MKEKLYTIPVTDAFKQTCECPLCALRQNLEDHAIEYTLGSSYMEDDVRAVTDQKGFCANHIKLLYQNQNRLGLALILNSHINKTIQDLEHISSHAKPTPKQLFKKTADTNELTSYISSLSSSCFVCEQIDHTFERYLVTIFHLYKTQPDFKQILHSSYGFCTSHYGTLYKMAPQNLNGSTLTDFNTTLTKLYLDHMKRVKADLDWFIDKFDYRNSKEPWRNSKDALLRSITKTNGVLL